MKKVDPRAALWRRFDEERYLLANPDVAAAVAAGHVESGRSHYQSYGLHEDRSLGLPPRRERLLGGLDPAALSGVEIGALMTPAVRKDEGRILYVDHEDTEGLREKYRGDGNVQPGLIVPVDVVWASGTFADALPPGFGADYVVASHVLEHVPDLVSWLQQIRTILKPDGQLRLAIPDRRFTFDYLRADSALSDLVDAYLRKAEVPLPRAVLDHCIHFRKVDPVSAWLEILHPAALEGLFSLDAAVELARRALEGREYLDVHVWVFTPLSFAAAMQQAAEIGLIPFACLDYAFPQPYGNEFFVGMAPAADKQEAAASWARMRQAAQDFDDLSPV